MMFTTSAGIVLRDSDYKDYDKILTVFTADRGLVTLKAHGVRRRSSDLKSACQLLCYSEFTWKEVNGYNTITEAVCKEDFRNLRNDIERLSLGFYFSQVIELIAQQDYTDPTLLPLMLNCLFALAKPDSNQAKIKAVFELRAVSKAGFQPDLHGCAGCGKNEVTGFDVRGGVLLCNSCEQFVTTGLCVPVSSAVLSAMRYIIRAEDRKILSFTLEEMSLKQLSSVTEAYLLMQLEHSFSSLNMYHSLFYTDFD